MKEPLIIFIYKDKTYKVCKEKDFRKYFNLKEIKCILCPKLDNPTVYYPIAPDKRLLSTNFHTELTFDISEFDLDEDILYFKDRFSSSFDTQSILHFIEYLSIFYKNEGTSAVLESAYLEDSIGMIRSIYPVCYKIDFDYGMESINSGMLNNATYNFKLDSPIYEWLIEDRMCYISDILFTESSKKNNSFKLPNFLVLKHDHWINCKYIYNCDNVNLEDDDLVLIKLGEYNSYYLLPYKIANQLMHIESFSMDVILSSSELIPDNLYGRFAADINHIHPIERDALCRYINEEYDYNFYYTFTLGDIYCLLQWCTFEKDIVNYLLSVYKVDISNPLLLIRHLDKFVNTTFTFDEIQNGKFSKHLQQYIIRRMK